MKQPKIRWFVGYAGPIEGADYRWCKGYARVTELGVQYPWLHRQAMQSLAKRYDAKAEFFGSIAEARAALDEALKGDDK